MQQVFSGEKPQDLLDALTDPPALEPSELQKATVNPHRRRSQAPNPNPADPNPNPSPTSNTQTQTQTLALT